MSPSMLEVTAEVLVPHLFRKQGRRVLLELVEEEVVAYAAMGFGLWGFLPLVEELVVEAP